MTNAPGTAPDPGPDASALDAFRARHGDIEVLWPTGRIRLARWTWVVIAAAILLGFTQSAEVTLTFRLIEVCIGVALLVGFVWLRGATPAGGGVRVDAGGIRLLPDGPQLPPDDIETIAIGGSRRMPALVARTRTPRDLVIPLRARLSGSDLRIALARRFAEGPIR